MVCEFSGFHQTTIKIRHVSCSRPLKYGVKCMEHSIIINFILHICMMESLLLDFFWRVISSC